MLLTENEKKLSKEEQRELVQFRVFKLGAVSKEMRKPSKDQPMKCPELTDEDSGGPYINREYCKSFSKGTGCRYLDTCENWKTEEPK